MPKTYKYQPKGGMCLNCANRYSDCSELKFETMTIIEKWDSTYVVKCSEFNRKSWVTRKLSSIT